MRKAILLAIVAMLLFAVESYASDPLELNVKRIVRKAANGGGTIRTRRANPIIVSMRNNNGTWGVKPRADGEYYFVARDAVNNNIYASGWYLKERMRGLGIFRSARENGGYAYARFKLSKEAKTRMANGENITGEINDRIMRYGFEAREVTKTRRDPITGESRSYKIIELRELPM